MGQKRGRPFPPGLAERRRGSARISALPLELTQGLSASGWTTEASIRVTSIRRQAGMERQVAEVDIEIYLRWYGQPTTREAGVERAVRQSGQPRAHTNGDREQCQEGWPTGWPRWRGGEGYICHFTSLELILRDIYKRG